MVSYSSTQPQSRKSPAAKKAKAAESAHARVTKLMAGHDTAVEKALTVAITKDAEWAAELQAECIMRAPALYQWPHSSNAPAPMNTYGLPFTNISGIARCQNTMGDRVVTQHEADAQIARQLATQWAAEVRYFLNYGRTA